MTAHPDLGRHLWLRKLENFLVVVEFVEHFSAEEVRDTIGLKSCVDVDGTYASPEAQDLAWVVALVAINVKSFVDSVNRFGLEIFKTKTRRQTHFQ